MSLQVRHQSIAGTDIVCVSGDVDIYSAPQLREALMNLIGEEAHDVVIDLSGVPVLDSVGLGVLVGALKRARTHGGTVRLAAPTAVAAKALRITGLTKAFSVHPDLAQALEQPYTIGTTAS